MLCSDKAPDKMFYACFILILTTSLPPVAAVYSIFLFHLILEKQRTFFFFRVKVCFSVMLKDYQMIPLWEIIFCDQMSPSLVAKGADYSELNSKFSSFIFKLLITAAYYVSIKIFNCLCIFKALICLLYLLVAVYQRTET